MRTFLSVGSVAVFLLSVVPSVSLAQVAPLDAVPFVTQISPSSLPTTATAPGNGNVTLTIAGANFSSNVVVNLTLPGNVVVHPFNTSVNQSGSEIVAQFANVIVDVPATLVVSVTNPGVTVPSTSNSVYLPERQASSGVTLIPNSNPLQGSPKGVVAADFTGNGNLGLAIVSQVSNSVSIFSGGFGGELTPGPSYPTGNQPWGIVAADFLGNGLPDLAITNAADNSITVLLANGEGTFRPAATVSLPGPFPGVYPTGLVAGDFNRDGKMDLAVVDTCGNSSMCFPIAQPQGPGAVTIVLGNGDGTFAVSPATLATGSVPYAIATADFNGDGVLDLVVANSRDSNVSVFMGNGDGTFATSSSLPPFSGTSPMAIAIGDFNTDGALDLAVANYGENTVAILLNQGCANLPPAMCTFAPVAAAVGVGTSPASIATADLNGDGFLDLAVANANAASVTILLGDGTGAFRTAAPQGSGDVSTGVSPQALAIGDVNQDGRLDVVTSNGAGSFTLLRQASAPQVALTTSNGAPTYGMSLFFTATITPPPGQPTPTGTIAFFDGGTLIGTTDLGGDTVFFQYAGLSAGSHEITAAYSGDSAFGSSTSNAVSESVQQAQSSATLTSNLNTVAYGQPFVLTATILPQIGGTATGPVSFFDLSTSTSIGQAVPVDNVAQLLTSSTLSPGAHSIAAIFEGDANLAASNSPIYIENITQATTTTTLSTSASPAALGQAVTLVATIQPSASTGATGAVVFQEGSTTLGVASVSNDQAAFTTTNLAVGSHVITAQYSGDTNYSGSTSAALTETVSPAASATAVSSSLNPAAFGQTVTFTATIQPPAGMSASGTVTFLDGTTTIGTASVSSNSAQVTASALSVGSHAMTAVYSGDTNLLGSTSTVLTQTVNPTATTTLVSATPTSSTYGQAVTLHASVTAPFGGSRTGTVAFFDGAMQVGTAAVSDNVAQLTLPGGTLAAGSHSITARYSGDANFAGSASAALATAVTAAVTSTTLNSSPNPALLGQVVTFTAAVSSTVAGTQSGTVSFFIDGSPAPAASVSLSGGTAQFSTNSLSASTHTVSATFTSSNPNFQGSSAAAIAQAVLDFATSASPSALTVSRGHSGTYTITVSPINGFTGVVALSCSGVAPTDSCTISPAQVALSGTGSVQATVTVTVSRKSTTGTRTLTFTATSGTLSHSTTANLTIK